VSSVLNRLIAANEQLAARVRHLEAAEVPVLGSDSLTIASGEITLTSKAPRLSFSLQPIILVM